MIEVNNLTKSSIDEGLLKGLGKYVLTQEGVKEEVNVSIAIVEEDEIKKLNRIYRKKDKPTDVLSFESDSKFIFPDSETKQLGEIVICPSQIIEQDETSFYQVFVHGLLHLLGYKHQTQKELNIMKTKQKKYLTSFFKKYGSA